MDERTAPIATDARGGTTHSLIRPVLPTRAQTRQTHGNVSGVLSAAGVRQAVADFFPLKSSARHRAIHQLLAEAVPTEDVWYPKLLLEEHDDDASQYVPILTSCGSCSHDHTYQQTQLCGLWSVCTVTCLPSPETGVHLETLSESLA